MSVHSFINKTRGGVWRSSYREQGTCCGVPELQRFERFCLTTGQMLFLEFNKILCSYLTNYFGEHKSELFFPECFGALPKAFLNHCNIFSVSDIAGFHNKG